MLTSERKIRKLFIKFITWNKKKKAINLLETYPECIMPWQKAFESAAGNNAYDTCLWILEYLTTKQSIKSDTEKDNNYPKINIHYQDDILLKKLEKMAIIYGNFDDSRYRYYLNKICNYDQ